MSAGFALEYERVMAGEGAEIRSAWGGAGPLPEKFKAKPSNLLKGETADWEVVVGMEVHAQVASKSKLFSGASTEFGGAPNSHVSLVDAAMPGMLPVINA